ncbi:MAG: acyltransferase family protein [Chiayiivirga sp.]|jgi:glucan biosynthesis protein C|uniref:acyltransferase family protein n=1 Tax=Chiayiivirga sp. TaxID=2041042 RepID=UPI0025BA510D|nr:acyltransferase family protein [Chiayiivirga sp.]MCI1730490.1 acyltransferase family protein [Chiayiivirga sp.]
MHTPSERLHGLDAVRGFALLLGLALHGTMSWLPGAQYFWIVADGDPSTTLGVGFHVIHLFRMTLFFLLAGFFARFAVERLGVKAFAKDRCKRIVLPLVTFWPIVMTGIVLALVWGAMLANGGEMPKETPPGPTFMPDDFPLTHLWFLYVLTLFYIAALALRGVVTRLDRGGAFLAWVDRATRIAFGPLAPLLLGVPVAVALSLQAGWIPWFGIPTPDQSLYPNPAALTGYGVAFGAGWLLQRRRELLVGLQRRWPLSLALALACTVAGLATLGLQPNFTPSTGSANDMLYALCFGVASWGWSLALLGLALRFLSNHSPVRRYLADASYWMYIMHVPLVMALQVAFAQLDWPWFVEYPLLLAALLAVLLLSYELVVRHTAIGAMLNGRKVPRNRTQVVSSQVRG